MRSVRSIIVKSGVVIIAGVINLLWQRIRESKKPIKQSKPNRRGSETLVGALRWSASRGGGGLLCMECDSWIIRYNN